MGIDVWDGCRNDGATGSCPADVHRDDCRLPATGTSAVYHRYSCCGSTLLRRPLVCELGPDESCEWLCLDVASDGCLRVAGGTDNRTRNARIQRDCNRWIGSEPRPC